MIFGVLFFGELIALFVTLSICAVDSENPIQEYRRDIKLLIELLCQKGYCTDKIIDILNIYN